MTPDLLTLFLHAVRVDGPSRRERPMADFIRRVLEGLPVEVREDDTARFFGGECGNILCVPRGFDPDRPAIALSAHMDTPRPTASVRPLVTADRVVSDGTGALGADDRAGVAVLLHALRAHLEAGTKGNFLLVFTAAEEAGLFGWIVEGKGEI